MTDILATTWNVQLGGKPATVQQILRAELAVGVSIFMLQEVNTATLKVLQANGLSYRKTPKASNAVAWTKAWTVAGHRDVALAPDYVDGTGRTARTVHTHSPVLVLRNAAGTTVEVLSFHTPSRVQRPLASATRMKVLKAAVAKISALGKASRATVFLAGGDNNVHLTSSKKWDFMRDRATGLTRIAPPRGTHGPRKIDIFWIRNGKPVAGLTKPGGGDHRLHRIRLRILAKPAPKPAPPKETTMPTFRGRPACTCLVAWLPVYESALRAAGIIHESIDIYQLIGTSSKSAGTHSKGGAYDIAQRSREAIRVARNMGAAAFDRPPNWDHAGGGAHQHGVLVGCPHNSPARYQIDALNAGYNGLGRGGRGGRDTGPRAGLFPLKTWQAGIKQSQGDWSTMATPKQIRAEIEGAINEMTFPVIAGGGKTKRWTLAQFLHNLEFDQDDLRSRCVRIEAKLDQLLAGGKR